MENQTVSPIEESSAHFAPYVEEPQNFDFEIAQEISVPIIPTQELFPRAGTKVVIQFLGSRVKTGKEELNPETGEYVRRTWTMYKFRNTKGMVFELFADAGMQQTLEAFPHGETSPWIALERLEKKDLGAGKSVNQWKVYSVTATPKKEISNGKRRN